MTDYHELPKGVVRGVYHAGLFGPPSPLAEEHISRSAVLIGAFGPELLGVFGAVPGPTLIDCRAYVWFSETPALALHKIGFLRSVHRVVGMLHAHYPELTGLCVDPRGAAWLRWIGADFLAAEGAQPFTFRRA